MGQCALVCAWWCVICVSTTTLLALICCAERMKTVRAAIASVKEVKAASKTTEREIPSQNRIRDAEIQSQGLARVQFEKAVRKAESDLMKLRYKNSLHSSDKQVKAEALAKVAFHRPGSFLTKEEIARIQQETLAECPTVQVPNCSSDEVRVFRTIDGTCNNLDKPLLGAAGQNFRRLTPPHYEDGIQQPRGFLQSINQDILNRDPFEPPNPSAREASRTVILPNPIDDDRQSHILMQWGQFLDHDMDLTPEFSEVDCPTTFCVATERCNPIPVVQGAEGDPNFGSLPCLFFPRSVPSCDVAKGEFPPREQFNVLTHHIDASMVYGSTDEIAEFLRDIGNGGRLKVGPPAFPGAKDSLPLVPREVAINEELELAQCTEANAECFVGGDIRVNEHLSLTVMHTIWLREHNRVVGQLAKENPELDDETLYQLGRHVVGGMVQAIAYQEWLPEVLGQAVVQDFILGPFKANGYNPKADVTVPNVYATAAFRYGHSLIRPRFARLDENYNPLPIGPLELGQAFFNASGFNTSGGTDPLLRGLLTENSRRSDEFLNPVLTTALFRTPEFIGRDLASLNINRGRDHGLAPYLVWREFCIKFYRDELNVTVTPEFRSELTELHLLRTYGSLDTVDIFPGGMAEAPFEFMGQQSRLGPTFTCIFIITFRAIAEGDRFFFLGDTAFTPAQRAEVQKTTLSRVVCDNADNIQTIQPQAFVAPKPTDRVACSSLPEINLKLFAQPPVLYLRMSGSFVTVAFAATLDGAEFVFSDTTFFEFNGSNQFDCIPIIRPIAFSQVTALALPFGCPAPTTPPGLPSRSATTQGSYSADVQLALMNPTNGIYPSESSCASGAVNALTADCTALSTGVMSQAAGLTNEDIIRLMNETYYSGRYRDLLQRVESAETNSNHAQAHPTGSPGSTVQSHSIGGGHASKEHTKVKSKESTSEDALLQSLEAALEGLK